MRLLILILSSCAALYGQTAENVLLVVNEKSPVSVDAGAYYAQKRGIAKSNILTVRTTVEESISRDDFERQVSIPIADWITRNLAHDRILYIVLTKGIPLRIPGTSGTNSTTASVDSELTLLYRKLLGQAIPTAGPVRNPYFLGTAPVAGAKKFGHADYDIYLVSRLDGYTLADIQGLIDRGVAPSREGKILLDTKGSTADQGDSWLHEASGLLGKMGFHDRVVLESTRNVLKGHTQVLGYYSWGSNDPAIRIRHFDLAFVPGALAGMFVSSDGRTFREPPAAWTFGTWEDKASHFGGSPQSLAGDLIRDGVTGIAGHVAEPYLQATIRPNILFPAYFSGFNLIESYYMAMPYLSWQTVVIGDPLCAPFRTKSLFAGEIDRGIDFEIELPGFFGLRRVKLLSAQNKGKIAPDAVRWMVRAEARMARQDRAGARKALEEATKVDGRLTTGHALLASMYEGAKEYDKAIERYRLMLERSPEDPAVLNNLAYALAVRKNSVREALPLAEKAYRLSKENPNVADTLGWIYHLAGEPDKAITLLDKAAGSGTKNPEIYRHLAAVRAARGEKAKAEEAHRKAVELEK